MAPNTSFTLASILEKDKLTASGTNFSDWYRNLRIVLRKEKKEYVLETPLEPLPDNAPEEEQVA